MNPNVDVEILRLLNSLASRALWWDRAVTALAAYGPLLLAVALVARSHPWTPHARGRAQIVHAAAALLLGLALAQLIRHVYFRPRPFSTVPGLHVLLGKPSEASFPSQHAVASAALAYFVGEGSPAWTAVAWALVTLAGVARVYAAVHYPSDVLGGIALGMISAWSVGLPSRFVSGAMRFTRPARSSGRLLASRTMAVPKMKQPTAVSECPPELSTSSDATAPLREQPVDPRRGSGVPSRQVL
ncbi:MAG: phosphatase PAP2 family protein [Armatimonadota bacterium]|nr:phosphatase PAP2 family protein [Armatimonadota bacterium]MDR7602608.1 phosphatase PAP2 family protein [Armatimonadota bacterium]